MTEKIHPITLPKLGLTMDKGSVASWNVALGDSISAGDEIADIETEKITNAYESPVSGTFRKIVADVGQSLPVGALIGIIADENVSDEDINKFIDSFVPNPAV